MLLLDRQAAGGESSTWLADATVRRLRRFRRKLLKRFCGPEEAEGYVWGDR